MKKKTLRFAAFAMALLMLPGCGKGRTPAEPTTVNQAMLLEQSAKEQTEYTFPEKFTGDWVSQEGRLTIHADAQVVAELGTVLPTATVTPRDFTQEDVDTLLRVLLKGQPLYSTVMTKQECQDSIDFVNSPKWHADPDAPEQTPEQLEERRKELIAYYTAEMAKAPEEKPIIHGFEDSGTPNEVSGDATVDGAKYEINIMNRFGGDWTNATIVNSDFKYYRSTDWGNISKEDAIAKADEVMQELGLGDMVLADAQTPREGERKGTWELYYTPSVNGVPIPGIREERVFSDPAIGEDHQYWTYRCSEETNADTVSWYMESVWITVGRDGILSFEWDAPSTEPVVKETQTALMPFEDIASIANTMLPVVIIGPSEARSLVEIDKINGDETYMDVEITKVSLSLMRIRDKGSLQGTIVPVWDFWGTWDWYEPGDNASESMKKGANYVTQPMLTLNAIDGNVVSRMFGY